MEKLTITMAMTSKARRAAIESGTLEQLRELLATNTGLSRAERSNAEGRIYRLTRAPKSRDTDNYQAPEESVRPNGPYPEA